MKQLTKFLCNLHNFIYFLIGQLATRQNHGVNPKHEIMRYHDFFVNNISESDTVLDIGCGHGLVASSVSKKAKKVIGMDIVEKSIQKAKQQHNNNLEFILGDATTYEFGDTFDAVILSNVLEHIENRVEFLRKIGKLSGKFLIRVPMINRDWLTLYKKSIGAEWRLDNTHFTEYTIDSFIEELGQADLRIDSHSIQFGEIWAIVSHGK